MTQHTPGPWFRDIAHIGKSTFEGKLCEAVFKDEIDGERTLIALVVDSVNPDLIAAAPDGLEVAKKAYVSILLLPPEIRNSFREVLCELRDFIAKATGSDFEDVQNEYEAKVRIQSQKED